MNRPIAQFPPRAIFALVLAATLCSSSAGGEQPNGFYHHPTTGDGVIVFASEGDLWKVEAGGGTATRLTAHEGLERFPRISTDGRWIAFTAQYEGNNDVYVMSKEGGEPRRLEGRRSGTGWK